MPVSGTMRFRYAVVFLVAVAYLLIAASFAYGAAQRDRTQELQCTIAAAQITAVTAALAQPGQDPRLQAARRHVLASWQHLSVSYGCKP